MSTRLNNNDNLSKFACTASRVLAHERRLAMTFLVIVAAFVVCYSPAIFLNIYEAVSVNQLVLQGCQMVHFQTKKSQFG
jgi:hypothetical protein